MRKVGREIGLGKGRRQKRETRSIPLIRYPGNIQMYGAGAVASPHDNGVTDEIVSLELREPSNQHGSQGQPS